MQTSNADERVAMEAVLAGARLAPKVGTVEEFRDWTRREIRPLFPHGILTSGFGRLHAGGVSLDYLVGIDFPTSYLHCIRNRAGVTDTPIMRRFLTTREPQLFEAEDPWPNISAGWLACFERHELHNAAQHGVLDEQLCIATLHTFYRIPGRLGPWHADRLRELVPIIHPVFCRVLDGLWVAEHSAGGLGKLSPREKQIVDAVMRGRTNRQIAALCAVTEVTVKHHLTSIFAKLGVMNRAQLVLRIHEHASRNPISENLRIL